MSQRLLILADGALGVFSAKTATSLVRYRPGDVAAVLDREHAGRSTRDVLGVPAAVPIVATLREGRALGADTLVIGMAPQGGQLPAAWRDVIIEALRSGLSVISGSARLPGRGPRACGAVARPRGQHPRPAQPPPGQPIAHMQARNTRATRVLTVGTDCNVGKMVAALELTAAARTRGMDARFVATGQTGMLISGGGVTLDRLPGDFMAGFVEELVLQAGDADLVVVEGQGSLLHPAYSGVTLALLHGALPHAMILVHHAGRRQVRNQELEIPPAEGVDPPLRGPAPAAASRQGHRHRD
jgi:uncharacterized NAD-dependent epimerase/dehydratase family protein